MTLTPSRPGIIEVTGFWRDYEDALLTGTTEDIQVKAVEGLVDLTPRLPAGFQAYYSSYDINGDGSLGVDTSISLPTRHGRIMFGQLCTIDLNDTPNVQILCNDPRLNLDQQGVETLIYDVAFSKIQYDGTTQEFANYAFEVPTEPGTLSLTDPALIRLPPVNMTGINVNVFSVTHTQPPNLVISGGSP